MPFFFRAVAVDYDGTLSEQPRASSQVLEAVRAFRDTGRRCILVTGRILEELRADFPDVREHFDAIVGENGAVLARPGTTDVALAPPLSVDLAMRLEAEGVPFRRGQVLLAMDARFDDAVYDAIRQLGLDCQLVRNRHALMVLPSGITKGSGVGSALAALNLSLHNTIAIGDAENDHALLDACEIGVAVGNAIDPLKHHADLVLDQPDGFGVAALLHRLMQDETMRLQPTRRQVALGSFDDGTPATIPASRVNVALYGPSGSGKSHVAGLLAEQLLAQQYTLCILDLEGDHTALGDLHGVVTLGGNDPLPPITEVTTLLTQGLGAVVMDLSLHDERQKQQYSMALLSALRVARAETGLPHWIFVDEAHVPLHVSGDDWWCRDSQESGLCVITYRPELICAHVRRHTDVSITLDADRQAYLLRADWPARRAFTPVARSIGHARHWHKYSEGQLPEERRFVFRTHGGPIGASAGNVEEFVDAISELPHPVLRHHAAHGDFSRWLGDLCRKPVMRRAVRDLEHAIAEAGSPDASELLRARLVDTVKSYAAP